MKGRKPTPSRLKALRGNPGKRALPKNEPKPAGELNAPPDWLTPNQQSGWTYALDNAPRGLLKALDRSVLVAWVIAEDLHRRAAEELERSGALLVKAPNTGLPIQSPYLPIINKQAQIMIKAAEQLGFSPAARPRLAEGFKALPGYENTQDDGDESDGEVEQDIGSFIASNPSQIN
jgi:P27 family predicted phage terminase small subunit